MGGWHVGVIAMGGEQQIVPPETAGLVWAAESGGATTTINVNTPTGMSVGDPMVACYGAGSYVGGSPWSVGYNAAWTPLYQNPESDGVFTHMFFKLADETDVVGRSYAWSMTVPGGLAGLAVAHVSWRRQHGVTVSNAGPRGVSSVPSPGGDWQLAFIYERTASNYAQPTPNPVITSPATLLGGGGSYRAGVLRVYISDNEDPITGAYLQGGIDFPRRGLVAAAVSA